MIQSMTAYARCANEYSWGTAVWEIRSVNHRYLDCIIKLPESWRHLELTIRQELQKHLIRGRIECSLKYLPNLTQQSQFKLNQDVLENISRAIKELEQHFELKNKLDPMKILTWPQVLETPEEDITAIQNTAMLLFNKTIAELLVFRQREGSSLKTILEQKITVILDLVAKLKNRIPTVILQQRTKMLACLADIKNDLEPSRLEQELVFFAQRIDITEEIDRLTTHAIEIQRNLAQETIVGKRLDFLSQELNREANTIASKAADSETTALAIELKILIEQIREQVQNLA